MKIGIIGAGSISKAHLDSYREIASAEVVAICDIDLNLAKTRANEYNIPFACDDYHKILEDKTIDAVSIVTPTFTHSKLVIEALKSGKHVLCEKPPALTYEEALESEKAAKESNKVLMYGFVCRFDTRMDFLKEYIDKGRLGEIYYAEANRMCLCAKMGGWFRDKTKSGGGALIDVAIHQLDLALYLMGYPTVKSVKGFATNVNKELPDKIKGLRGGWVAAANTQSERTIESFANGLITFENNKCLYVKSSHIANTFKTGGEIEILADKGGIHYANDKLRIMTIDQSDYFMEIEPKIEDGGPSFLREVAHFIDACNGKVECCATAHQGAEIIKIITAIYESAETGKEILF